MAVKASMCPPIESTSEAIASAERLFVPLKTMCSMKWLRPVCSWFLVAAAPLHPHAHRDAAHVGHGFGEQRQTVGQHFFDDHERHYDAC